jgi:hypothetical protein
MVLTISYAYQHTLIRIVSYGHRLHKRIVTRETLVHVYFNSFVHFEFVVLRVYNPVHYSSSSLILSHLIGFALYTKLQMYLELELTCHSMFVKLCRNLAYLQYLASTVS